MISLKFSAHNGLSHTVIEPTVEREDVRQEAADRIRRARKRGMEVSVIEPGKEWEMQYEGSGVGDQEGLLYIVHYTFPCRECGNKCETEDAARQCCQPVEEDEEDHMGEWEAQEVYGDAQ